tara:strand:+ start:368 stop:529 length:162 start_codon:yes stop_codon:yes gene_type:complete
VEQEPEQVQQEQAQVQAPQERAQVQVQVQERVLQGRVVALGRRHSVVVGVLPC